MTGLRPYVEETKSAALAVIARLFGERSCLQAEKILCNPLLDPGEAAGDVVFYEDRAVGTQFAIKRRLYLGQAAFFGTIGGMLAMDKAVPAVLLVDLMKSTKGNRWNRKVYFANTAIPVSMKMNRLLGVKGEGVDSCGTVRFAVLKVGGFLNFALHGKLPSFLIRVADCVSSGIGRVLNRSVETERQVNISEIDAFWSSYVAANEGVVSSRTGAEIEWAFGREIVVGIAIMVVHRKNGRVDGYVVVKESKSVPGRWLVVDWIAHKNDQHVLVELLKSVKAYLRRDSRAFLLECIGFPMRVQDVIGRVLRFRRRAPNNSFIYQAFDKEIESAIKSDKGWFFGPYDGDRCLS